MFLSQEINYACWSLKEFEKIRIIKTIISVENTFFWASVRPRRRRWLLDREFSYATVPKYLYNLFIYAKWIRYLNAIKRKRPAMKEISGTSRILLVTITSIRQDLELQYDVLYILPCSRTCISYIYLLDVSEDSWYLQSAHSHSWRFTYACSAPLFIGTGASFCQSVVVCPCRRWRKVFVRYHLFRN